MDGIAPYRGYDAAGGQALNPYGGAAAAPSRPPAHLGFAPPHAPDPAAVKTPAHYLGAARRRFWLILAVAAPLSMVFSIVALRQPKIYQARAEIVIEAPTLDPILSTLVAHGFGGGDPAAHEKYAPNMVARLQSKGLAERVVANARLAPELAALDDPAQELIVNHVGVKPLGKTNMYYLVTLDGKDPALTKRLLEGLLEELKQMAHTESRDNLDSTIEFAKQNLEKQKQAAVELDKAMYAQLGKTRSIGPGGRNILELKYDSFGQKLAMKQARIDELNQKMLVAQLYPRGEGGGPATTPREQRLAELETQKQYLTKQLEHIRDTVRRSRFDRDPAANEFSGQLDDVLDEMDELRRVDSFKTRMASDPSQMIIEKQMRELEEDQAEHQSMLAEMQAAMPEHQKFLGVLEDRQQARVKVAQTERDIASFEILAKSQKEPVRELGNVAEPTAPIKPNRLVSIAMGLVVSFALGFVLVFALEHFDHSVRVPEHVSHGLSTPLLGVVPRIVRTALTHRGGHLWTPAAPDSLAADAFRNVRASLLGVADRGDPIVSLLVTSAKAGDGKSTTALNLAATCARAGERTLLLDVDLRRPSLNDVFPTDPDADDDERLGLVDVLRGAVPWQRTLRRTDLHNLDFIPTGDPRDVPIEILGTLELRQLLTALSHHYDRVILDGPAVLGMADCRVLGRMVDASVLVVRAGAHQIVTLQRAKAVLEQSRVEIAGVIVNSLSEGVKNWSSYGYPPAPAIAPPGRDRALEAPAPPPAPASAADHEPDDEETVLMAAAAR